MKKILLIFWLLSFTYIVKAQEVVQITAKISDSSSGRSIPNASITNLKKRTVVQTDTAGFFHLTLLRSDVLRISAVGYETEYIAFADTTITSDNIRIIKMLPKIYSLPNVDIYAARWKDFEFDFAHTEVLPDPQQGRIEDWFHTVISEEELRMLAASASVGIPIPYTSDRQKQMEKVRELSALEYQYDLIALKFNAELVTQSVDIEAENVDDFMKFCNFSREFILSANKYDLIVAIKQSYKTYQKTLQPGF